MDSTPILGVRTVARGSVGRAGRMGIWPALGTVPSARTLVLLLLSVATYAAAARVSLLFAPDPQHVAAIWPPAGIALGMLLVTRTREWAAVAAGIALAVAAANLVAGVSVGMTGGFVAANTLEPLLAAWALRRSGFTTLRSLRSVGLLLAYGAIGAPAVAAVIGAATVALGAGAPFMPTYVTWLLSDAGGVLAVAPLILLIGRRTIVRPQWRTSLEAVGIGVVVVGLTSLAFLPLPLGIQLAATPIFLFVVVAAVRFGMIGAALSTSAVAFIATAGTIGGHGPFVLLNSAPTFQIGQVQVLVVTTFLISFVTAATIAERRAAADELAARAATNGRVTSFARAIARTLDPEATFSEIVRGAIDVVAADVATLSVKQGDGEHRIVAAMGAPSLIGRTIASGDGLIGAVIRDGTPRVADRVEPGDRPSSTQDLFSDRALAMACVPVVTDGAVGATLGLVRVVGDPFSAADVRALTLMADLAAIAMRNAVAYAQAQDLSIRDELTGLPNRRYFTTSFDQLAAHRARQNEGTREVVSALLFDLDHFGTINKERGHATGDRVLSEFGKLLASRLRRADVVARYGGEEFVAVLAGTDRHDAVRVADQIRAAFEKMAFPTEDGESVRCTVSAGVATIPAGDPSLATLVPTADVALSMAKRAGRNMVAAA
ncbi:MAG TPA: diguanylate cyclase [Candidatus Limnocylindria bacterium]|nr:diguanylate cyclase [Candidatus Limnocylindria bacterium]